MPRKDALLIFGVVAVFAACGTARPDVATAPSPKLTPSPTPTSGLPSTPSPTPTPSLRPIPSPAPKPNPGRTVTFFDELTDQSLIVESDPRASDYGHFVF